MDLKVTEIKATQHGRDENYKKTYSTLVITPETFASLKTNRSNGEYEPGTAYRSGRWRSNPFKETPRAKSRVYVSVEAESMWDDFENRTSRPHTLWAKPIKDALIAAGWPKDVKLRWSQKAGCSCPCSPAFFVTGGPLGVDLWVTIAADMKQSTDPEEAAHRGAALARQL